MESKTELAYQQVLEQIRTVELPMNRLAAEIVAAKIPYAEDGDCTVGFLLRNIQRMRTREQARPIEALKRVGIVVEHICTKGGRIFFHPATLSKTILLDTGWCYDWVVSDALRSAVTALTDMKRTAGRRLNCLGMRFDAFNAYSGGQCDA